MGLKMIYHPTVAALVELLDFVIPLYDHHVLDWLAACNDTPEVEAWIENASLDEEVLGLVPWVRLSRARGASSRRREWKLKPKTSLP